jgi:probable DNA metabolism protein
MFNWSNLIYHYDGSFEGLLCCVFESYDKKEIPNEIFPIYESQLTLFPVKEIITDSEKANRVLVSIPKKMGASALEFVQLSFLTCLAKKELYIVLFLRMGYSHGPSVMNMLSDDVVNILYKAVKHLNNESHLLKGFIRFSIINNALFAEIEPKNFVLPLLTKHFCERYPEEHFLIYDKAHSMALMYKPYKSSIIPIDSMELSQLDDDEKQFQDLWKLYYDTVEIEARHNEKCRRSHMPKRYWKYLTEFKIK